ncbi:hypothetical protein KSP39_PZI010120 [Platanthera zijinensis]|uniref:Uncharacterized protein n=1 Tax=Platanthera zijinensis TaxID=2320716 RepID=A0AAP0G774_9ASPA
MRLLGWVQSKISGRKEKKFDANNGFLHNSSRRSSCKEEFEDWPQALLAIGTFGSNAAANDEQIVSETDPESAQENHEFSAEEMMKLQNEISKLLNLKPCLRADGAEIEAEGSICSSSKICSGDKIMMKNSKDVIADKCRGIKGKSLSFLLKKMFVCRDGFDLHPSLRDPIPESLMEKIMMKILHKKIHPQAAPRGTGMKYLQGNNEEEKGEDGGKWVKTDSEYIILEI